jgi:hypothetical protein
MTSLFEEVLARGIPYDHYRSDLYIPANEETEQLCRDRDLWFTRFRDELTRELMLDCPFQYSPYWERRSQQ